MKIKLVNLDSAYSTLATRTSQTTMPIDKTQCFSLENLVVVGLYTGIKCASLYLKLGFMRLISTGYS